MAKDTLTPTELSAFCAQVAMIMKSGISVGEGILIMIEDMKHSQGRDILVNIENEIEFGSTFSGALKATGKFPKYVVDMSEIGEATGKLDDVMDSLSAYYEREENISRNIRSALTYPLVMIAMMVLVILVLVVRVMPVFNDVFTQLGSEMTGFSRSVMNMGVVIGQYSFVFIGILILLIAGYGFLRGTDAGRRALARFASVFFVTRGLNAKIASGRFASAMSLMLMSGLDTDQSLEMVFNLVDNDYIRNKITRCKELISGGANFSEALVKTEVFSGIYARMVTVGFRTGSVDMVMRKLADRYEEEVDTQIGGIISILEPTLVAVLSVIVGMILLSVMLPLMGIMSSIG